MKYKASYKSGAVCLPLGALDLCENLLEVRLLMYLSHDLSAGDMDDLQICARLACSEDELKSAVASLRAGGLLEPEQALKPSQLEKNLSGVDMSLVMEQEPEIKTLIDECQNICGKIFTPTDISRIVGMRKSLGFDCGSLLMLFSYYGEKLDSVGRKLTVSYVEKSAFSLYNQGIKSFESIQNYITQTEQKHSISLKLRKLLGIGDRSFTKKEKKFFDKWVLEWNMPFELIELAFNISVDTIGKAGLEYMSKILSDWHEQGITTAEQAVLASEEYKKTRSKPTGDRNSKATSSRGASFEADEFFEKALKRSYDRMLAEVAPTSGKEKS